MKTISSVDNPIIKRAMGLKDKKIRDREGVYLIDGFHICMEALKLGKDIDQLIVSQDLAAEKPEIVRLIEEAGVRAVAVPPGLFKKIADVKSPAGLAALVKKDPASEKDFFHGRGNFLVLDRVRDPGNVGTLIRTSEAAGFAGVIALKGTADVYSPKVVRAGAGSILRQPLLFLEGPEDLLALVRHYKISLAASSMAGATPYYDLEAGENLALVIGNEGEGVSSKLLDAADILIEIPMSGQVESLNAAVAGGILMYWLGKENTYNG